MRENGGFRCIPKWRAAVDEDGHYSFAVALRWGIQTCDEARRRAATSRKHCDDTISRARTGVQLCTVAAFNHPPSTRCATGAAQPALDAT
jgi:hypothetical protein